MTIKEMVIQKRGVYNIVGRGTEITKRPETSKALFLMGKLGRGVSKSYSDREKDQCIQAQVACSAALPWGLHFCGFGNQKVITQALEKMPVGHVLVWVVVAVIGWVGRRPRVVRLQCFAVLSVSQNQSKGEARVPQGCDRSCFAPGTSEAGKCMGVIEVCVWKGKGKSYMKGKREGR
jgi:hypothetical protein